MPNDTFEYVQTQKLRYFSESCRLNGVCQKKVFFFIEGILFREQKREK